MLPQRNDHQWGSRGGHVFTTAMATLTLEVYYRYLPLRKTVEGQQETEPPAGQGPGLCIVAAYGRQKSTIDLQPFIFSLRPFIFSQKKWRKFSGSALLPEVIAGVLFKDGMKIAA